MIHLSSTFKRVCRVDFPSKIFPTLHKCAKLQLYARTMAFSTQFLENQLELLQVSTPTPFASCWPDSNPLDFFRIHIARSVAEFLKIDAANVFPALRRPSVLSQGDL